MMHTDTSIADHIEGSGFAYPGSPFLSAFATVLRRTKEIMQPLCHVSVSLQVVCARAREG